MLKLYKVTDVDECRIRGSALFGIKLQEGLLFVGIAGGGGGAMAVGGNIFWEDSVEVVCRLVEGGE